MFSKIIPEVHHTRFTEYIKGLLFYYISNPIKQHVRCLGGEVASFFLFFWSGLRSPKAYSLWGGVVPSPSIGCDYL